MNSNKKRKKSEEEAVLPATSACSYYQQRTNKAPHFEGLTGLTAATYSNRHRQNLAVEHVMGPGVRAPGLSWASQGILHGNDALGLGFVKPSRED